MSRLKKLPHQNNNEVTSAIRCLFVLPWDIHNIGGVNQVVRNLIREFSKRDGSSCELLVAASCKPTEPEPDTLECRRQHWVPIHRPITNRNRIRGVARFLFHFPRTVFNLRSILVTGRINCINVHYPSLSAFTLIFSSQFVPSPVAIVLSFHGADLDRAANASGIEKLLWRRLLSSVDAIVVCSSALGARLKALFPSVATPIVTIHNGVSETEIRRSAKMGRAPSALQGKTFILNAATFEYKKAQDVLVKAFALLAPEFPDTYLVLMGHPGKTIDSIRSLICESGIADRVAIYTDVPHAEVLATMRKAKLFVLPSRQEPFGIVLLESGICSCPVVCTNTGGIPEIITHEETGLLVPVDDTLAMSGAIKLILENGSLATRLGKSLEKHVQSCFSWTRAADNYKDLIVTTVHSLNEAQ